MCVVGRFEILKRHAAQREGLNIPDRSWKWTRSGVVIRFVVYKLRDLNT